MLRCELADFVVVVLAVEYLPLLGSSRMILRWRLFEPGEAVSMRGFHASAVQQTALKALAGLLAMVLRSSRKTYLRLISASVSATVWASLLSLSRLILIHRLVLFGQLGFDLL